MCCRLPALEAGSGRLRLSLAAEHGRTAMAIIGR